jgi:hypothetical protein
VYLTIFYIFFFGSLQKVSLGEEKKTRDGLKSVMAIGSNSSNNSKKRSAENDVDGVARCAAGIRGGECV